MTVIGGIKTKTILDVVKKINADKIKFDDIMADDDSWVSPFSPLTPHYDVCIKISETKKYEYFLCFDYDDEISDTVIYRRYRRERN